MKLLVVDDEKYTREGILNEVDFEKLGIDEIVQAKNGLEAYKLILEDDIDILLTDVKMPKMNGIELAYKLQSLNRHCPIVFMSGYSDKEYLKSAIELNAVRYIEKPLDIKELETALLKCVSQITNDLVSKNLLTNKTYLLENDLAINLTRGNRMPDVDRTLLEDLAPNFLTHAAYQTLLIMSGSSDPIGTLVMADTLKALKNVLGYPILTGFKDLHHLVLHMPYMGPSPARHDMAYYHTLLDTLIETIKAPICFSVGTIVETYLDLYQSYREAVLVSKQFFLHPETTIFIPGKKTNPNGDPYDPMRIEGFNQALMKNDFGLAMDYIASMTQNFKRYGQLLPEQVRSYYYQYLLVIKSHLRDRSLDQEADWLNLTDPAAFFETRTLQELSDLLTDALAMWESLYKAPAHKSPAIASVLAYIRDHYMDPEMKLTDIADAIPMSLSHMCVLFKKETDMTINHYLTRFRLHRSLKLLEDQEMKLAYVAQKSGFNDANYYAKLFKKTMGLTPSDYRETIKHEL